MTDERQAPRVARQVQHQPDVVPLAEAPDSTPFSRDAGIPIVPEPADLNPIEPEPAELDPADPDVSQIKWRRFGQRVSQSTEPSPTDKPETPHPQITLAELEELAIANNPTLQQADALIRRARGRRTHAGRYPNPTFGYQGTEIGNEGAAGQQGLYVSQTFVVGDKLDFSRAAGAEAIHGASWQAEAQRLRVMNGLRLRYFEVLGAQQLIELAEELQRIAAAGVKAAQDLLKIKNGSLPDVRQAEIQLSQVGILLQNARNRHAAVWRRLANVVGSPDLPMSALAGQLEDDSPQFVWDATLAQLMADSPELRSARANVNRAAHQLRREEVEPIPNVNVQLGVQHDFATGDAITTVQVGLPLPIFYGNEGNITAADAELHRAEQEIRRLELSLRDRLATAFLQYENAREQVRRYRTEILPKANETLKLTTEGYEKFGEFNFLRVLTARRTYFEATLAYVKSLTELRKAEVVLSGMTLTGGLNAVPE